VGPPPPLATRAAPSIYTEAAPPFPISLPQLSEDLAASNDDRNMVNSNNNSSANIFDLKSVLFVRCPSPYFDFLKIIQPALDNQDD